MAAESLYATTSPIKRVPSALGVIKHNRPTLGVDDARAAQRVLDSGWVAQGPEVESFENEVCEYLGLPAGHAVAVSSGTAALFLALKMLKARRERVLCPVYACAAVMNAIVLAQARPVLADTAREDPNIDMSTICSTNAGIAIVPHMFGIPVDVSRIKGLRIIEDAAQALGARTGGKPVGIAGEVGIISFYATKVITSGGQGGMLVSRNADIVLEARDYREFDGRRDRHARFNFQMTDIQAAIGRVQLSKLGVFLDRRDELFDRYKRAGLPVVDGGADGRPVRYRCVIRSDAPQHVIENLARSGIGAIVPINDWELLGRARDFPSAASFSRSTVSLPIYPSLSDSEQDRVIDGLRQIGCATN